MRKPAAVAVIAFVLGLTATVVLMWPTQTAKIDPTQLPDPRTVYTPFTKAPRPPHPASIYTPPGYVGR